MRQKKQHTVPRCYLENFTDSSGMLHVLRRTGPSTTGQFTAKPASVLTGNNFYTVALEDGGATNVVENALCQIEGDFTVIYDKKISKYKELTSIEKRGVSQFVAAMMLRTKAVRASYAEFFSQARSMVEEMSKLPPEALRQLASFSKPSKRSIPADKFLAAGADLSSFQAKSLMFALHSTTETIVSMKWRFYVARQGESFLTSDNPVCLANPTHEAEHGIGGFWDGAGLAYEGVELCLPLSSTVTLLAGWIQEPDGLYVPACDFTFNEIRERALRSGFEELVANDPRILMEIDERRPKPRNLGE